MTVLPNNLPVPVTSLFGRERDIEHVEVKFADHRLVTLTGAGGSGQTRLAQHVAADVLRLAPDGAWWVDLAAQALGAHARLLDELGYADLDADLTVRVTDGARTALGADAYETALRGGATMTDDHLLAGWRTRPRHGSIDLSRGGTH